MIEYETFQSKIPITLCKQRSSRGNLKYSASCSMIMAYLKELFICKIFYPAEILNVII